MSPYRVWGTSKEKDIEFRSLTDATLGKALNLLKSCFFGYETVSRAVGLVSEPGAIAEIEKLCLDVALDGVSVVAVDVNSGHVVGVALNKIQVLTNPLEKSALQLFSENCIYKSSKALVNFIIDMDSKIDLFRHYKTDCIFKIMFLALSPINQTRWMEEQLVSSCIEVAKELRKGNPVETPVTVDGVRSVQNRNAVPGSLSAVMTSNYSEIVAEMLRLEKLATVSYGEFSFDGRSFSERVTGEHQTTILVATKLQSMIRRDVRRRCASIFCLVFVIVLVIAFISGFASTVSKTLS